MRKLSSIEKAKLVGGQGTLVIQHGHAVIRPAAPSLGSPGSGASGPSADPFGGLGIEPFRLGDLYAGMFPVLRSGGITAGPVVGYSDTHGGYVGVGITIRF